MTAPGNQVGSAFVEVGYRTNTTDAVTDIQKFNSLAQSLVKDIKTNVDVDTGRAQTQMAAFRVAFESLGAMVARPDVDTSRVFARAAEMRAVGASVQNAFHVAADLDTTQFHSQLALLRAQLAQGLQLPINANLDQARYQLAINALRARLASEHPRIEIETHIDRDRASRAITSGIGGAISGASSFLGSAAAGLGNIVATTFTETARHGFTAGFGTLMGGITQALGVGGRIAAPLMGVFGILAASVISFVATIGGIFVTALIGAAAVAIGVALSGVAGLILAGGFIGIAAAAIALGIAAVMKDPRVQAAFERFKHNTWDKFMNSEGVKSFVGPLVQAMDRIGEAFQRWMPMIDRIMKGFSPLIAPVTGGLISMIDKILPSLMRFAESGFLKDLVNVFAQGLPKIGEAIGTFIDKFLNNGPAMKGTLKALEVGFDVMRWAIVGAGDGLAKMAALFGKLMEQSEVVKLMHSMGDALGRVGNALLGMVERIATNERAMKGINLAFNAFINVIIFVIDIVGRIIVFFSSLIGVLAGLMERSELVRRIVQGVGLVFMTLAFVLALPIIALGLVAVAFTAVIVVIGAVIGALIFAIQFLATHFMTGLAFIRNIWNTAWQAMFSFVMFVWNAIVNFFVTGWTMIWAAFQFGLNFIQMLWTTVWGWMHTFVIFVWTAIVAGLSIFWTTIWTWFQIGLTFVQTLWTMVWGFVMAFVQIVWGFIMALVGIFITTLMTWFQIGLNFIQVLWSMVWGFVQAFVLAVWSFIMGFAAAFWGFMMGMFNAGLQFIAAIWSAIWNFVAGVFSAIINFIMGAAAAFWGFLQAVFSIGLNFIASIWSAIWNFVYSFFVAIVTAISNAGVQFWNFLTNLFVTALNALHAFWNAVWNAVMAFVLAIWTRILTSAQQWWGQIRALFESALNAVHGVWNQVWAAVQRFVLATWVQILQHGQQWWDQIKDLFKRSIDSVHSGWNTAWNGMREFFVGTMDKIVDGVKSGLNRMIDLFNKGIDFINEMLGKLDSSFKIPKIPGLVGGGQVGASPTGGARNDTPGFGAGGTIGRRLGGMMPNTFKKTRPGRTITGLGGGREDRVPLMGSRGEFIVNRKATSKHLNLLRSINSGRTQAKTSSNFQNKAIKPWRFPSGWHNVGDRKNDKLRKERNKLHLAGGGIVSAISGLPQGFGKKIIWRGANGDNEGLMNEHRDHVHAAMGAGFQAVINAAKSSGVAHTVGSTSRPGANDFHGQGKAVDFPGHNQDALATMFGSAPGVIELIHRTATGDYGIFSGGGGGSPLNKFFQKGLDWVFKHMLEPVINKFKGLFERGKVPGEMGFATVGKMVEMIKKKIKEEYEKQLSAQNSGGFGGPISTAKGSPLFEALEQAKMMGADRNAVIAMVAAGIVESGWKNILSMLDHDSIGVLQQRTSQGWGSLANLSRPAYQAANFLSRFRMTGTIGQSAQAVQKSAFPAKYDAAVGQAMALLKQAGYPGFVSGGAIFDSGGILPTGTSVVQNLTGKPEPLRPVDLDGPGTLVDDGDTTINVFVDGVLHAARVEVEKNNSKIVNALNRGRGL